MRRTIAFVVASVVGLVALVGLAHMPFARSLLARAGGCPFPSAARRPTEEEADALRIREARRLRGESIAPSKPALGFTLGETHRGDVRAWAATTSSTCIDDGIGLGVRCRDVDLASLPGSSLRGRAEVSFGFDLRDRLVSASFIARATSAVDADALAGAAEARLASIGPAQSSGGDVTRAFQRRVDTWAYADYFGEIAVTHLGTGVLVTARHLAIPN